MQNRNGSNRGNSGQGQGRGQGQSCGGGQGAGRGQGQGCVGGQGAGRGQGQGAGRGQGQQAKGRGAGQGRRAQGVQAVPENVAATDTEPEPAMSVAIRKIAVSTEGPTLTDRVDPRFGRAGGFAIVDAKTMDVEYVDNGSSQAMAQGAGIQAAETVANAGAQVLLTGYVGPKAFTALTAAGIAIGQDVDGLTVGEAVEKFKNGGVTVADTPNAEAGGNK